jgi:hypothetical protein
MASTHGRYFKCNFIITEYNMAVICWSLELLATDWMTWVRSAAETIIIILFISTSKTVLGSNQPPIMQWVIKGEGHFIWVKMAGAWGWPTSHLHLVPRWSFIFTSSIHVYDGELRNRCKLIRCKFYDTLHTNRAVKHFVKCSDVAAYQRVGGPCCLPLQGEMKMAAT